MLASNLELTREKVKRDVSIKKYFKGKFPLGCDIKYWNFGFIVVPKNEEFVYKYYLWPNFHIDWVSIPVSYHIQEKENYDVARANGFILPNYEYMWQETIGIHTMHFAKLENIRKKFKKITNFSQIPIDFLGDFFKKLHKEWYTHGNIHPSNFFITPSGIWMFDLINYGKWDIHKDIWRILIYSDFNDQYFFSFLEKYSYSYNLEKIFKYCIWELYNQQKQSAWQKEYIIRGLLKMKNIMRKFHK